MTNDIWLNHKLAITFVLVESFIFRYIVGCTKIYDFCLSPWCWTKVVMQSILIFRVISILEFDMKETSLFFFFNQVVLSTIGFWTCLTQVLTKMTFLTDVVLCLIALSSLLPYTTPFCSVSALHWTSSSLSGCTWPPAISASAAEASHHNLSWSAILSAHTLTFSSPSVHFICPWPTSFSLSS